MTIPENRLRSTPDSAHPATSLPRSPVFYLIPLLLLLIVIVRFALGPGPDPSLHRVQQAGVLVVAFDASYPPFETTDGLGNYSGLDVSLAQELARRLGVQVRFANIPFDNLYDAIANRSTDLVISGIAYEAERTQDVLYSLSYFDAGQVLVVRASDPFSKTVDLAGRRVAVESASEGEVEARKLAAKTPGMQIQGYETPEKELAALRNLDVDALVTDHVTALDLARGDNTVRLMLPPFAADPLVVAGHIQDRTLMSEVNRAIKTMLDDGTLARLAAETM